jgi:predicted O-methyltransferase YrrM
MTETRFRKYLLAHWLVTMFVTMVLVIVTLSAIAPELSLWKAASIGSIVAVLLTIHVVFEYFIIGRHFDRIAERRFNKIVENLNERDQKLMIAFEEHRKYVDGQMQNLVDPQLASSLNDFVEEAEFSNEAQLLQSYIQRKRQEQAQEVRFTLLQKKSQIIEVYLSELFPGIEKVWIPVGAINEETGHANHVDLLYVSAIARHLQCRNLFEFGTYLGRTSYHLTYASEGATVYTLNLHPDKDSRVAPYLGKYFHSTDREPFITQILGDSREFDTTPYRKKMDFIFVDGDHSYETVKNDTIKALEMLAPGGTIIWHDYAAKNPGLVEFFKEFTQDQPLFRIKHTCLLLHLDGTDPLTIELSKMRPSLGQA